MTFPFASLPENLVAFCTVLRREHRFRIGPREILDAAHGLELADLANERAVRDVLRPILSKTVEDAGAFDTAFERFFHGRRGRATPREGLDVPDASAADSGAPASARERMPAGASKEFETDATVAGGRTVQDVADAGDDGSAVTLRAGYSPFAGEGAPLVIEPPTRAWLDAAAALAARVHAASSRRWRPAKHGPRFDFRRTLRTSLHTGGEPITPRWRAHPRHRSRVVMLIDGSRSMGNATRPALHTAVALSAASSATETFVFSTMLRRITREVRRAAAGERRMVDVQHAWGSGTTIGACLAAFLHHDGERLLGPDTVVIIVSDGLDVGAPDLLRHAMARLARRSAAIVWLNPLLDTTGYEPSATGMSLARPHLTTLASIATPENLRALARTLRVR